MGDSGKQICRLCLEITPSCESEHIDEIKKDILEVSLINVDFEITDNAVACNRCLEKLQDCFDFKTHCIKTVMDVDVKMDIKREDSPKSTGHESSHVCRFCMALIGEKTFNHTATWKDEILLKDMIRSCLPDMDLNILHEPEICKLCLNSVKKYFEFMKICQEVEQSIELFRQEAGHGTADRIRLEDVLKYKDYNVHGKPLIIKKECSDVNVNLNGIKRVKEAASIKCEEIHIKDELQFNEMEIDDLDQSEDNENIGKDGFSKTEWRDKNITQKGKRYFCSKNPNSSGRSDHIKNHMRTHSDNESHKCFLCPFITDTKFALKAHMTSHKGPTKRYGCPKCPYETNLMADQRMHILKHKDESEVEMLKCPLCPYRNKFKKNLARHQFVHVSPKDIPMYKCAKCKFETKHRNSLIMHVKRHQDPEIVNKFKCEKCPFRAKFSTDIRKHMVVHSDKRPFSCDQCPYSGRSNSLLLSHKHIHQTDAERKMYECKLCSYQAKHNKTLKIHIAKFHSDSTTPVMKCANCSYETTVKCYLSKHMIRHHCSIRTSSSFKMTTNRNLLGYKRTKKNDGIKKIKEMV